MSVSVSVSPAIECIDLDDSDSEGEPPCKVSRMANGGHPCHHKLTKPITNGNQDNTRYAQTNCKQSNNKEVLLEQVIAVCVDKLCAKRVPPLDTSADDHLLQTLSELKAQSEERVRFLTEALEKRRQTIDKETQTNVNGINGYKCGEQQTLSYSVKVKHNRDVTSDGHKQTETSEATATDPTDTTDTTKGDLDCVDLD